MIRVWGYLKELEEERTEINRAIDRVLKSGMLILGEEVSKFEESFATYCQCKYGVGVNSGTDALFLALKAIGIGPGDEVITVPNTAVPTISAIASTGAIPRFVDVNQGSCLMNTSALVDTITSKTKCILPVHLYGQCVDMAAIKEVAGKYGLKILEDCAQCHGATQNGQKAGSMSDLSAFSFYPTKILGGYGDGGMVITNSEELRDKMRRLRFYGMEKTYYSLEHGYNSRLDELHASILREKLKHLDEYIARRRALAKRYDDALKNTELVLPIEEKINFHAYYLYVVRHKRRAEIIEKLKDYDISVNISYPWPIHVMPAFAGLGYKQGGFPVTEKLAKEVFSLPMYPSLSNEEQDSVVEALLNILQNE